MLGIHDKQDGAGALHHPHPPDWSNSDTVLEHMVEAEERSITRNRQLLWLVFGLLALVVAALVMSVVALNRDIESVAKATPKDASVSAAAIQGGAVTAGKLADGAVVARTIGTAAVTNPALADASVGRRKLRPGAVDGSKVAPDSITGTNVNEATLGSVPRATRADSAGALEGKPAAAYLSGVQVAEQATARSFRELKEISATCPSGTRVIGGGAAVAGTAGGVSILESTPNGRTGWRSVAEALGEPDGAWSLVVTAICATGGATS